MKEMRCSKCNKNVDVKAGQKIDNTFVCFTCLYGTNKPLSLIPIGTIVNDKARRKHGFGSTGGNVSEIHLAPGMAQFMKGLEEESHLVIVWYADKQRPLKTVFARGWDGKRVGPFASRTPYRLNPICVTEVELLEVKGTILTVQGLDAINGTPVLDIKVSLKSLRKGGRS